MFQDCPTNQQKDYLERKCDVGAGNSGILLVVLHSGPMAHFFNGRFRHCKVGI
jgi:hypothetical protein